MNREQKPFPLTGWYENIVTTIKKMSRVKIRRPLQKISFSKHCNGKEDEADRKKNSTDSINEWIERIFVEKRAV